MIVCHVHVQNVASFFMNGQFRITLSSLKKYHKGNNVKKNSSLITQSVY